MGYYTTVKMMMKSEFKRRRQIPAEPGWRAVMCDVTGETYTLRLVPLVGWGMTRRGKEPIIDDDKYWPETVLLGRLDPTEQFIEEEWAETAAEAVKEDLKRRMEDGDKHLWDELRSREEGRTP